MLHRPRKRASITLTFASANETETAAPSNYSPSERPSIPPVPTPSPTPTPTSTYTGYYQPSPNVVLYYQNGVVIDEEQAISDNVTDFLQQGMLLLTVTVEDDGVRNDWFPALNETLLEYPQGSFAEVQGQVTDSAVTDAKIRVLTRDSKFVYNRMLQKSKQKIQTQIVFHNGKITRLDVQPMLVSVCPSGYYWAGNDANGNAICLPNPAPPDPGSGSGGNPPPPPVPYPTPTPHVYPTPRPSPTPSPVPSKCNPIINQLAADHRAENAALFTVLVTGAVGAGAARSLLNALFYQGTADAAEVQLNAVEEDLKADFQEAVNEGCAKFPPGPNPQP